MSRTLNFDSEDGEVAIVQDKVNVVELKDCTMKIFVQNNAPYLFHYDSREKAREIYKQVVKYINEEG